MCIPRFQQVSILGVPFFSATETAFRPFAVWTCCSGRDCGKQWYIRWPKLTNASLDKLYGALRVWETGSRNEKLQFTAKRFKARYEYLLDILKDNATNSRLEKTLEEILKYCLWVYHLMSYVVIMATVADYELATLQGKGWRRAKQRQGCNDIPTRLLLILVRSGVTYERWVIGIR